MKWLIPLAVALTAGPALAKSQRVSCLNNRDIIAKRLTRDGEYFAQTRQGWWRNERTCDVYRPNRFLSTFSIENRQCTGDAVGVHDAWNRIMYGQCGLGFWERAEAPPPDESKGR